MKQYVKEYLAYLTGQGRAKRTVDSIRYRLKYFYDFLKGEKTTRINRETFERYTRYMTEEKKYKPQTRDGRIEAIRGYFRYLTDTKRLLFNPADRLEVPKCPKTLPDDIPSHEEIVRILNSIETVTRVGKRRKAVLELLYSTAIRANELLNLETFDVNFKENEIFVRKGKFNKDRVVPFGREARLALKGYIDHARKYHAQRTGETKLFLSTWGNKLKYKEFILVMGGARRKNGSRLKAHSLRHACAVGMLRNGADIRYIQELLGHKLVTSTQIYTQILPEHLREVNARYHPRAKIKKRFVLSERIPLSLQENDMVPTHRKTLPLISRNLLP